MRKKRANLQGNAPKSPVNAPNLNASPKNILPPSPDIKRKRRLNVMGVDLTKK